MAWQPIETAPKDGTLILCWQERRPNGVRAKPHHRAYVARHVAQWGWLCSPSDLEKQPTHWMPLPSPPSGEN